MTSVQWEIFFGKNVTFLAFVRRVNQVKVIDSEFFEFFPQALFVLDGMDAALFLGEDVPGIETDAFGQFAIREANDEFFPEGFLAKFIVAEHVGGFFFKVLGDLVALVELVKLDDIGVTGVEQVFEYLVFEGIDGCHFSLEGGSLVPLGHKRGEGEKFDEGVDLGVCEAKIHDGVECGRSIPLEAAGGFVEKEDRAPEIDQGGELFGIGGGTFVDEQSEFAHLCGGDFGDVRGIANTQGEAPNAPPFFVQFDGFDFGVRKGDGLHLRLVAGIAKDVAAEFPVELNGFGEETQLAHDFIAPERIRSGDGEPDAEIFFGEHDQGALELAASEAT